MSKELKNIADIVAMIDPTGALARAGMLSTPCDRTLAIYRPGVPMPGMYCSGSYRGGMPNTGRHACHLCGRTMERWHDR